MSDHHPEISEERLFFFDQEEITVCDFEATGYILDIGGGGNGVIGRLKGGQVIAIDPSKQELEGAVAGPLKIIMDATDLQFLDETFDTVTSFYTLMYIKEAGAHRDVLEEGRGLSYYVRLAGDVGFEVASQGEEGQRLFLELRKP